ncbi:MAG: EamA family transporter [Candidatus Brennerbacteria bacterium]
MTPLIFAWIASLMYGVEAIAGKLASKHTIQNPWLFNFFWALFILLFTIPIAAWQGISMPAQWVNIALASLFYALTSALYVLALYQIDVSIVGSLYNFRTVITVILGALFVGEILTLTQYVLILLIFVGGIFVSVDEKFSVKSFFSKGIGIGLLGVAASALMAIFIKKAVAEVDFWSATLWIEILGQVWILPTILLFKKDLISSTLKQYLVTAATAIAGVIGTLAAIKAYAANVSLSSAIISLPFSLLIAFLFSRFAPELLEKHTAKVYVVRFVSAAVMIVAALNL